MDERETGTVPALLRREVEPPQRQPTGVGVLLLASASMFFAVAGSAFMLRARVDGESGCPYGTRAVRPQAQIYDGRRPAPAAQPDCTQVVTRTGPNGEQLVDFKLCP